MPRHYRAFASEEEPETCQKCGEKHWQLTTGGVMRQTCAAHRMDGHFCQKFPIQGGKVCDTHGGRAPQVRKHANARKEVMEMQRKTAAGLTAAGIDLPEDVDPIKEALRMVSVAANAERWLAYAVARLGVPEFEGTDTHPELADVTGIDGDGNLQHAPRRQELFASDDKGVLRTHPLWVQWNNERQRLARFAKLAVDAGVSERMVRIQEAQAELVVEAVVMALDALALPAALKQQATDIIVARFREIESQTSPLGIELTP